MELSSRDSLPQVQGSSELLNLSCTSNHENLQFYIEKNQKITFVLRCLGVLWISSGNALQNILQWIWNYLMVGLGVLYMMIVGVSTSVSSIYQPTTALRLLWIFNGITLALQAVSMGFSLYDIRRRLKSPGNPAVVENLAKCLHDTYLLFGIIFVLSITPCIIGLNFSDNTSFDGFIFLNFASNLVLTSSFLFISGDCSYASSLLDELIDRQKREMLTCEQFIAVRDEIRRRHLATAWVTTSIVLVGLMDVACILFFVFINLLDATITGYLIMSGLFLREMPFLMLLFWKVAHVNEKSSRFIRELGSKKWSMESHADHERISVYVSAQSYPIELSLAGMKLKRQDLAWQFALWCIAFVVSFVKAAVEKRVA